jgi:hypothetical protein
MWVKIIDVIPSTVDMSKLANPARLFIESAEYHASSLTYIPHPRGVPSVWELGQKYGDV